MRVVKAFNPVSANALRTEVLSELKRQPWWWSTPLRALFASEKVAAASGDASSEGDSTSLFQEANIRSSFRRRLLVLPVDDPENPSRNTPLGGLCREAIRAVVTAHTVSCVRPDGTSLLSPDARLVELTAVVALPGAFAQDPHADIIDEDENEDDDELSSWGEDAESYPEDSYLGIVPQEKEDSKSRETSSKHASVDPSSSPLTSPKNPLPTLLTSWVSLQPVGTHGGATVIFPGTHNRGAGLTRMAPKAVRAYRGSDLSEEDERFIQLMHGDAVDAANEGYAMAALELTDVEAEDGKRARREAARRERWWRRLRLDAAGAAGGDNISVNKDSVDRVLRDAERRERDGAESSSNEDIGEEDSDRTTGDDSTRDGSNAKGAMTSGRSRTKFETEAATSEERDPPPLLMTNENPGDLVVMDTKVWHFGGANRSFVPRILLNVTFQEPSLRPVTQNRKREDVLTKSGWVADSSFDFDSEDASTTSGSKQNLNEVRRIDGFTYHIHGSILGKYAVQDFMPGGAMY